MVAVSSTNMWKVETNIQHPCLLNVKHSNQIYIIYLVLRQVTFVVNRRYSNSIFNMFTESNYFVNFCLNVPPPPSTVSIFCECTEHKNSEFYSIYINVQ